MITAKSLKRRREKLGLSQSQMARALNDTPVRTYQGWEGGRTIPPHIELAVRYLEEHPECVKNVLSLE